MTNYIPEESKKLKIFPFTSKEIAQREMVTTFRLWEKQLARFPEPELVFAEMLGGILVLAAKRGTNFQKAWLNYNIVKC